MLKRKIAILIAIAISLNITYTPRMALATVVKENIKLVQITNDMTFEKLEKLIEENKDLKEYLYTEKTWLAFRDAYDRGKNAIENKKASNEYIKLLKKELEKSVDELKIVKGTDSLSVGKDELEILIENTKGITSIDMIEETNNKEIAWECFLDCRHYAKEILHNTKATHQEVTSVYLFLKQTLDEFNLNLD